MTTTHHSAGQAAAKPRATRTRRANHGPDTRRTVIVLLSGALTVFLMLWFTKIGTATVTWGGIFEAVHNLLFDTAVASERLKEVLIIQEMRLPRVLLAAIAGAALSLAGVVMQAVLRNPLVSPFTLGVSPAAAFGAALSIFFFGGTGSSWTTSLSAFIMAGGVSAIILTIANVRSRGEITLTLLLLGIALTQLFEAATSALQFFSSEQTLAAIVRWTFGSVNEAQWQDVQLLLPITAGVAVVFLLHSKHLNAIAFAGDDAAKSLGINVGLVRSGLIGLAVLLASFVVSTCGVIGFVGLVGPHIARMIIGPDHRFLVPFSAVCGALLLMTADAVGRTIIAPIIVPVGIVIAVIGAPLFIYLILTRRNAH